MGKSRRGNEEMKGGDEGRKKEGGIDRKENGGK